MSIISFDKLLKIIYTNLSIISYAIGLLTEGKGKVEPTEVDE